MSEVAGTERRMRFNWRLLFAVLIPGPIAGMVAALILSVTAFADLQPYSPRVSENETTYYLGLHGVLFFGAFAGGTWGLLPMLFIGLPSHTWLMRRSRRQVWLYASAACLAGLLFGGVAGNGILATSIPYRFEIFAWYLAAGACAGIVAGLVFWLIRRPDRDAVSAQPQP